MRRLVTALLVATVALPASAAAYPWPFRPFGRQHPIRGGFGDPRTVFQDLVSPDGLDGPGAFSFHQGVDIAAPDGTPIYPVTTGWAHYLSGNTLEVVTGRTIFQYFHVVPVVGERERVVASRTVLGYVEPPYGHVHLTEIDRGRAVDPLLPGHLSPYRDTTRPTIVGVAFRDGLGGASRPSPLCGRVQIDAEAYDTQTLPVPGEFHGFPLAPALVSWSILRPDGSVAVRRRVAADFRRTLPAPDRFWSVYARGTYQNVPRFGSDQYVAPGRYLFQLAGSFDTSRLRDGSYVLVVHAADERGNATTLRQPFSVLNSAGTTCDGSLPADPPLGLPIAEPPVLPRRNASAPITTTVPDEPPPPASSG